MTLQELREHVARQAHVPVEQVDGVQHIDPKTGRTVDSYTAVVHPLTGDLVRNDWHRVTVVNVHGPAKNTHPEEV